MIEKIEGLLLSKCTAKQKEFSKSITPNSLPMLGVKTNDLRNIAKDIVKGDYRTFLTLCEPKTYEMQMIKGYVIASAKMDINERFNYIDQFIPTIKDWAVHDGFVSTLKCSKKYLKEMYEYLLKYVNSKNEYEVRFVAVMLMSYYLEDEYIDSIFKIIDNLYLKDYYAKMGVAWLISTSLAKYPSKTISYLKNNKLDSWTQNKAIQKSRESFRVSKELKEEILMYRK